MSGIPPKAATGPKRSDDPFGQGYLEEVLDRKLGQVVKDLLAVLTAEFERLSEENSSLAQELQQFRECNASPGTGSAIVPPPLRCAGSAGSELQEDFEFEDFELDEEAEALAEADCQAMVACIQAEIAEEGARSNWSKTLDIPAEGCETAQHDANAESHPIRTSLGDQALDGQYENFSDIERAFHALCADSRATISARELVEMRANQKSIHPTHPSLAELRPRLEAAVSAMNQTLGIPAKEITLETFIAIMQKKKLKTEPHHVADKDLPEIRDILVKEDAFRKVAKATNMTAGELYLESAAPRVGKRMAVILKYLDHFIALVIILNAGVICLSTDFAQDSEVWTWFEGTFTLIFMTELFLKLAAFGPYVFFFGPDKYWNCFDTMIVIVAALDLIFTLIGTLLTLRNFTVVRLLRFAKLVRLLKLKVFKELALMVNGILVGFRTLVWAIVFLGFLLFTLGVLLTHVVGQESPSFWTSVCDSISGTVEEPKCVSSAQHLRLHHKELFGNVFRSMFTVFRCFTDGCVSIDGTPLIPYFFNTYGAWSVMVYMLVILFVIFGLFNLIMAIFVESTIDNAKRDDARRCEARYNEHMIVARKLQEVIVMFCTGSEEPEEQRKQKAAMHRNPLSWLRSFISTRNPEEDSDEDLEKAEDDTAATLADANLNLQVTHAVFDKVLQKKQVQDLLDDLDIGVNSRASLFDILDADCSGTLEVSELVHGLLKLRGGADKGDHVASLLAIRAMQKSFKEQQEIIDGIASAQERLEAKLERLRAQQKPWSRAGRYSSRGDREPKEGDCRDECA